MPQVAQAMAGWAISCHDRNAADARPSMEASARYAEDASRFLGIFEAISVAIAIAGAALGIVGVTRLFSAQRDLAQARKRVDEEMSAQRTKFDAELTALRTQFETEVREKEGSLAQMSEILLENLEQQRHGGRAADAED